MNYYGGKELAASFRTVRKNTITIAQDIPEEKYSFRPVRETRSVVELLAHIALSYSFQYKIHAEEHRGPAMQRGRGVRYRLLARRPPAARKQDSKGNRLQPRTRIPRI